MFENELDKLRAMLDEAEIPYDSYQEEWKFIENLPENVRDEVRKTYGLAGRWLHNQVIYGADPDMSGWRLDGICQYGSYGANEGLIETYGSLGVDAEGDPLVLRAEDVFEIIKADWDLRKEKKHG